MLGAAARRFAWAAVCAFAVIQPASGQDRRIDELMQKSGIWQHMGQVQASARLGAEEARKHALANPGPNDLTQEQHNRLLLAMDKAFSPIRLRAAMRAEMLRELSAADEATVLEWLSTDLGTRITRLEEARDTPEGQLAMEKEAPHVLEALPRPRRAMYERLAKSINAGESSANMIINVTTAIAYGVVLSSPHGDVAMVKGMRDQMEAQRAQMVEALGQRSMAVFAHTYRELDDAEMEKYVAFAESPAGKRYHDATTRALDKVMAQAAVDLGRDFGAKPLELNRRS